MKDEIVNAIVVMLSERGIDTDGIADRLYMLLKDVEITRADTALTVRNDVLNESLLTRFLGAKAVKGCTKNTIKAYGNNLKRILKEFNKSVTDITSDDIRFYTAYRLTQDKVSKSYMNTELRYLRTFFAWLFSEEIIPKNPMIKIDAVKVPKVKRKAFSDIECEKLRSACRTSMDTAIIEMFLSTGCRVSELCAILILDLNEDRCVVHGKGNKDRTVYLNAKAQIAVEKYLSERSDSNPYLFPVGIKINLADSKAKQMKRLADWYKYPEFVGIGERDKGGIESTVRKIGKKAGIDDVHPHRFRRTCATMALRRGMPIEMVSKMLGHEQLATTQIYLDLSEHELEEAHKKYVV